MASLFTWLQAAQYLTANPSVLVSQKTGDDREHNLLDTTVLCESAVSEILRFSWEAGALPFTLPDPVHSAFSRSRGTAFSRAPAGPTR